MFGYISRYNSLALVWGFLSTFNKTHEMFMYKSCGLYVDDVVILHVIVEHTYNTWSSGLNTIMHACTAHTHIHTYVCVN